MRPFRLEPKYPTEHAEQVRVIEWSQTPFVRRKYPEIEMLYHTPNGGARDAVVGRRLKDAGTRRGIPDLFLPVPRQPFHGLYLELKRRDGGTVSDFQRWWIERLRAQGFRCEVCHGADAAIKAITEYLTCP